MAGSPIMNIFIAGKKKSGKDFIADVIVDRFGFRKIHIAEPWIRRHLEDMGVSWDEWLTNKHLYRDEIQRRATKARADNPNCLIDDLPNYLGNVVVSGVRFINESEFGLRHGLVLKVVVDDRTRYDRFIRSGEDLGKFDDPFESEIDQLLYHVEISGSLSPEEIERQLAPLVFGPKSDQF